MTFETTSSSRPIDFEFLVPVAELGAELAAAADELEVWQVAAAFMSRQLGGQALVLRRHAAPSRGATAFAPVFVPDSIAQVEAFDAGVALDGMGSVPAPPPGINGGGFSMLFQSVPEAAGGGIVYVQVDDRDVLLLAYGDAPPVLSRGKWLLLHRLARLTAVSLARVRGAGTPLSGTVSDLTH